MRAIETARPEVQAAMEYIVDVIACADGGVSFHNFLMAINRWTAEEENKPAAGQLLDLIVKFSRLLKAAQPHPLPPRNLS